MNIKTHKNYSFNVIKKEVDCFKDSSNEISFITFVTLTNFILRLLNMQHKKCI